MKKALLSFLFLFLASVSALAADGDTFTVSGVTYTVSSEESKTVEVSGWKDNIEDITTVPEEIRGYTVTSIGDHAFSECSELYAIKIPTSVTSIGASAFKGCTSLTSLAIPSSVKSISDYTFNSCSSMTAVKIPASVTSMGINVFFGCERLASIICLATTPPAATTATFAGFSKSGCTLTVPEGFVDTYKADKNWYGFNKYEEQESVLAVGETFTIEGVTYKVTSDEDKTVEVCGYTDNISADLTLPLEANGYDVTSIGNKAFSGCNILKSIEIPHSVTSMGDYAFDGCTSLTFMKSLAFTPPVVSFLTFSGFDKSACKLTVPEGCVEDYRKVDGWTGFKEIVEPGSDVGDTFTYNGIKYKITSLEPKTVEVSGYKDEIEEILILPEEVNGYSVTSIGRSGFRNCKKLLSIEIPASVETIGDFAFYNCTSLNAIEIPASTTSIGIYVFSNCSNLIYMSCLAATPPAVSTSTFMGFDKSKCTLKVPEGCEATYQATPNWDGFKYDVSTSLMEIGGEATNITINGRQVTITGTDESVRACDLTGREILPSAERTFILPKGVAIILIGSRAFKVSV